MSMAVGTLGFATGLLLANLEALATLGTIELEVHARLNSSNRREPPRRSGPDRQTLHYNDCPQLPAGFVKGKQRAPALQATP
jgi:hypothetical protein